MTTKKQTQTKTFISTPVTFKMPSLKGHISHRVFIVAPFVNSLNGFQESTSHCFLHLHTLCTKNCGSTVESRTHVVRAVNAI